MDQRIFFMLNQASRELNKTLDRYLVKHLSVTGAQIGALFFLMKNDGCLLKKLSKGLSLNNSAVTGLIGRMTANGLVTKAPCSKDGRAFRIFITEKGKNLAGKGYPMVNHLNQIIGKKYTEKEIDVIVRFLNDVVTTAKSEREGI